MINNYKTFMSAITKQQNLVKQRQELYSWKEFYVTNIERFDNTKPEITDFIAYTVREIEVQDRDIIKNVSLISLNFKGKEYPVSRFYKTFKTENEILMLTLQIDDLNKQIEKYKSEKYERTRRSSNQDS